MKKLLRYIIDYIVKHEEELKNELQEKPKEQKENADKEQKYIVDFGNQQYGAIVTVNGRKEMYTAKSNPPGLIRPNKYTFDEIAATDLFDYSALKEVPND